MAKNKNDDEKLSTVLSDIHREDPTLTVEYSRELKQVILSAQGELHLQATKWKLENLYKMQVDFEKTKIPYREQSGKKHGPLTGIKNNPVVQDSSVK